MTLRMRIFVKFFKCSLEPKPEQRKGSNYRIQEHLEDVLLKWLDGSSVKEKYCKVHSETERNITSSPRV